MPTRRDMLKAMAAAGIGTMAPVSTLMAKAPTDRRLVVVVLRGGLDGLSVVPPTGERDYYRARPNIAVPKPGARRGALDLGGGFGLHPGLAPLLPLYRERSLLPIQAVGLQARTRSHFDAQDILENGTSRPRGAHDGWLNRSLAAIGGSGRLGLSVGHGVPLIIRGPAPIRTWEPSFLPRADTGFLDRLAVLYRGDPLFAKALKAARMSALAEPGGMGRAAKRAAPGNAGKVLARAMGKLLVQEAGPRIAVIEVGGWDTHVAQAGALGQRLPKLAEGLMTLKETLGPVWDRTAIVAVSEFGRTVAENGGRGTDHGTAGMVLLLGGAVAGGRVAGRWPGLSKRALFEDRDLMPTTDIRSVFKGVLRDHFDISEARLEDRIFPGSRKAPAMAGLIRKG